MSTSSKKPASKRTRTEVGRIGMRAKRIATTGSLYSSHDISRERRARPSPAVVGAIRFDPDEASEAGHVIPPEALTKDFLIAYDPKLGINEFVVKVRSANPIQLVETEREGVKGRLVKDLAVKMDIPVVRFYKIIGVRKATVESKTTKDKLISGAGGQRALAMVQLLGMVQEMLERSTAPGAKGFDSAKWLGAWIERPQPALGGHTPAEFLDTPTGFEIVSKVLGALESGSYQ